MPRTKPPFRADEVGSLLRTDRIKEARAKREKNQISAAELSKIEDSEIEKIVQRQASVGLKLATAGEFRRSWWHFDFLRDLIGCEMYATEGIQFQKGQLHRFRDVATELERQLGKAVGE